MIKHILFAVLSLIGVAHADTHTFVQSGSTSLQLGTAPDGATGIRARIIDAFVDFGYGYENTADVPVLVAGNITHGYTVSAGGVSLASGRVRSQTWQFDLPPWDGVIDYGGPSGETYHEDRSNHNDTPWGYSTFSVPPTALTINRRTLYDLTQYPQTGWHYLGTSSLVTVEWEWTFQ